MVNSDDDSFFLRKGTENASNDGWWKDLKGEIYKRAMLALRYVATLWWSEDLTGAASNGHRQGNSVLPIAVGRFTRPEMLTWRISDDLVYFTTSPAAHTNIGTLALSLLRFRWQMSVPYGAPNLIYPLGRRGLTRPVGPKRPATVFWRPQLIAASPMNPNGCITIGQSTEKRLMWTEREEGVLPGGGGEGERLGRGGGREGAVVSICLQLSAHTVLFLSLSSRRVLLQLHQFYTRFSAIVSFPFWCMDESFISAVVDPPRHAEFPLVTRSWTR
ncbi:hypothetical protein AAG570_000933 [Ranatra chinensis]|uniref:Uncharacterized protein n=1 Tax=Ranatra chinensis TaxID=642074 RepID=A0ABD0ZB72_9HEMI